MYLEPNFPLELEPPVPMFGIQVCRCHWCHEIAVVREYWFLLYAGSRIDPPEYDVASLCAECVAENDRQDALMDRYYDACFEEEPV